MSLEINGKLLTGLKLGKTSSRHSFSREVWLEHFSTLQGSIQFEGICLLKVLVREAENRGIPSRAMLELGHCCTVYLVIVLISFLTSSSVRGWKESNMSSSFTGTLGIVIGSGSWLSSFVLIFWIFLIKKSPNACARSFNESKSGYCSCCNGFVSDLMISKSFFWSPAHSWTFPE